MVPNRCFFVFLGPMKFSLVNYLAVRSAAEINKPESLLIYYETHPEGLWWDRAREYVTDLIQVDPPRFIGSFAVEHPAHQSDLVRLTCLLRDGGVYLDLDVLSVRDLSPLREFSFVIGEEGIDGREGLCNAVMLAEPGSTFVAEWLNGHYPKMSRWSGFRARGHDEHWDEMSCKYPAYLAALFPGDIRIERHDSFHWPTWYEEHLQWFFRGKGDQFPNAYCHHLWNFASGDEYLSKLTPEYIRSVDTNFNVLARPYFQD